MNHLPLNIDWQQILLHIGNLMLLVGGLYVLLVKPVKKIMDKREEHYKKLEDDAKKKEENIENLRKEYENKIHNADIEINQMKTKAAEESELAAKKELEAAKIKAEDYLSDARRKASNEHKVMLEQTQKEITKLALDAAKKVIIAQKDPYDSFMDAANKGDNNE